jgi:hypothetical protein
MFKHTIYALVPLIALALVAGCANKDKEQHATWDQPSEMQMTEPQQQYTSFGEPMKPSGESVPVGMILASPTTYDGKYVRLEGTVSKVCQSKGCWMELSDPTATQAMFVKFTCPIEGRLLPAAAVGKPVVVEGIVRVKTISQADARHIKQESGATPEQVAMIKGPQLQITVESPGAQIAGLE